jgi:clusterin-associated protein 1
MENFRKSNFQLVAEILYWLVLRQFPTFFRHPFRYEPNAEISDNINGMQDRIIFIKSICELFASKARLKLDAKRLYVANNKAVSEMQKIAKMLYKA